MDKEAVERDVKSGRCLSRVHEDLIGVVDSLTDEEKAFIRACVARRKRRDSIRVAQLTVLLVFTSYVLVRVMDNLKSDKTLWSITMSTVLLVIAISVMSRIFASTCSIKYSGDILALL